jgi:hypothetical protein
MLLPGKKNSRQNSVVVIFGRFLVTEMPVRTFLKGQKTKMPKMDGKNWNS